VLGVLLGLASAACARDIFVATNGDDSGPGTLQQPFATLNRALSGIAPGDTCYLRAGRYHETIENITLKGTRDRPITITSYKGERVILDGTVRIDAVWTRHKGDIFKAKLPRDMWQLFVDGKSAVAARWPNARIEDGAVLDVANYGTADKKSPKDAVYDERLRNAKSSFVGCNLVSVGNNNIQKVTRHTPGEPALTFAPPLARWRIGHYCLEGQACLDAPYEWWVVPEEQTAYLCVPEGADPNDMELRGKTQDYALNLLGACHLRLKGITFFATTFSFKESRDVRVEDCVLSYPNHHRRMIRAPRYGNPDFRRSACTQITGPKDPGQESRNVFRNCELGYAEGFGLRILGHGDIVENNLFHHIGFTGLERYPVDMAGTVDAIFRRNTVHSVGGYAAILPGRDCQVELNDCYHGSELTHESTLIHCFTGNQAGTVISRNWTHDSHTAIRFDTPNNGEHGFDGTVCSNVAWRVSRIILKGDRHKLHHNTLWDCDAEANDIVIHDTEWKDNANSEIFANAADTISGHRSKRRAPTAPFPGKQRNNWIGYTFDPQRATRDELRDPENLDFRPKPGSVLAAKGIGAYPTEASHYWIPGRQLDRATRSIPPDGAASVRADADLIWLEGIDAVRHEVYHGPDRQAVASAAPDSPEHQGTFKNNICSPGTLKPGQTYYWRVDAVTRKGIRKGHVWSFTVSH